jgi:hypothetical protein
MEGGLVRLLGRLGRMPIARYVREIRQTSSMIEEARP